MAAADAMVHSTAGLTVLEAHIRGCPVVSYGFSVGHLRANNHAFERFGLAEVARSEHELESVLRHLTRERLAPASSFASLPSIASKTLGARPRIRPQPVWRLRAGRLATAAALTVIATMVLIVLSLGMHWETPYRVIAKPIERRLHIGKQDNSNASGGVGAPGPASEGQSSQGR